jgi:hypothetical protein
MSLLHSDWPQRSKEAPTAEKTDPVDRVRHEQLQKDNHENEKRGTFVSDLAQKHLCSLTQHLNRFEQYSCKSREHPSYFEGGMPSTDPSSITLTPRRCTKSVLPKRAGGVWLSVT